MRGSIHLKKPKQGSSSGAVLYKGRAQAGWAVVLSGKRQLLSCSAILDCRNASPVFADLVICKAEIWNTLTTMLSFKNVTSEVTFQVHVFNCVRSLVTSDL